MELLAGAYLRSLSGILGRLDLAALERIALRLREAREQGAMVYIAGNGGSAATASHWVNDLGKAAKRSGRKPIRVMSLNDNTSWLTALANDEGYENAFAGQLDNFAQPGDVLVVISASGNSMNLVRAVELARVRNVFSIGLLGFDGGILKTKLDDYLWVPTEKGMYELVEDVHCVTCHILTTYLVQDPVTATHSSPENGATNV